MTSEEVKPLRDYLQDKKQMIDIMFSCVEESHVRKMIPDVLKDMRMEEVREECLVELLGMSKKRILTVLDGRELDESSDSLELSDISEDEIPVKSERQSQDKKTSKSTDKSKTHGRRKSLESLSDSDSLSDRASPPKTNSDRRITAKKSKASKAVVEEPAAKKSKERGKEEEGEGGGKNLLEILELEMRARAIRSLLQREETANKGLNSSNAGSKISSVILEAEHSRQMDNDDENDVIIIDEGTDEIDLTRDDSDTEVVSAQEKTKTLTNDKVGSKEADDSVSSKALNKNSKVTVNNGVSSKGDIADGTSRNTNEVSSAVSDSQVSNTDQINDDRVVSKSSDDNVSAADDGSISTAADDNPSKTDDVLSSKDLGDKFSTEVVDGKKSSNDEASTSVECRDAAPRNWTERWLDNSDVKLVMKTSRVLTNLKKRLITNSKQKAVPRPAAETEAVVDQQPITVEGTVSEFFNLQRKAPAHPQQQPLGDQTETVQDVHLPEQADTEASVTQSPSV